MNDADRRRAAAWMASHGYPGYPPPPLLVARLSARWRTRLIWFGVTVVVATCVLATLFVVGFPDDDQVPIHVVAMAGIVVVAGVLHLLSLRMLGRNDRRIGPALHRRVTHSAPVDSRMLLGPTLSAYVVALHGAAVTISVGTLVLAATASDRVIAGCLTVVAAACGVLLWLEVATAVRRPALADDGFALWIDDALRVDDARDAARPGFVLFALVPLGTWLSTGLLKQVMLLAVPVVVAFAVVALAVRFRVQR